MRFHKSLIIFLKSGFVEKRNFFLKSDWPHFLYFRACLWLYIVVKWISCHGGFVVTPILSVTHCWASEQDTCHWDKRQISKTSASYAPSSISSGFCVLTNNRHWELRAHTIDFLSRHFVYLFLLNSLFIQSIYLSLVRCQVWCLVTRFEFGNIIVQFFSFFSHS